MVLWQARLALAEGEIDPGFLSLLFLIQAVLIQVLVMQVFC